jgi:predicted RNA-binding protein with RPS1 domain
MPSPWEGIETRYPVASRHKGTVVNLMPYGAFVKLEDGVEGLVHVSEMSWTRRVHHPSEVVNINDEVEVVVLDINHNKQEISLGMKQTEANPWSMVEGNYPVGTVIEGQVRNLTNYGAFVELEEGIDGLLHVSDMSWTKKINHPSETLKIGDTVKAVVLSVDAEKKRVALGLKQLNEDPWKHAIPRRFLGRRRASGAVTKSTNFGVFVELEDGLEGLLHISELGPKGALARRGRARGRQGPGAHPQGRPRGAEDRPHADPGRGACTAASAGEREAGREGGRGRRGRGRLRQGGARLRRGGGGAEGLIRESSEVAVAAKLRPLRSLAPVVLAAAVACGSPSSPPGLGGEGGRRDSPEAVKALELQFEGGGAPAGAPARDRASDFRNFFSQRGVTLDAAAESAWVELGGEGAVVVTIRNGGSRRLTLLGERSVGFWPFSSRERGRMTLYVRTMQASLAIGVQDGEETRVEEWTAASTRTASSWRRARRAASACRSRARSPGTRWPRRSPSRSSSIRWRSSSRASPTGSSRFPSRRSTCASRRRASRSARTTAARCWSGRSRRIRSWCQRRCARRRRAWPTWSRG